MNSRFAPQIAIAENRKHARRIAARAAAIAGVFAALAVTLAATSCTPAAAADSGLSDGQTFPADWTENPTAAIVYEPIAESGASHE